MPERELVTFMGKRADFQLKKEGYHEVLFV